MSRFFLVGALALTGSFANLAIAGNGGLTVATPIAYAQSSLTATVTDAEVNSYARSVLQMENARNNAYTNIKNMMAEMGLNIGDFEISCSNTTLSEIPRSIRRQVRRIIVDYCNSATNIVTNNGLEAERFNVITAAHRQDSVLEARIRQAMIDLQQ